MSALPKPGENYELFEMPDGPVTAHPKEWAEWLHFAMVNRKRSPENKRIWTAVHEAGHAVAAIRLGFPIKYAVVYRRPYRNMFGCVMTKVPDAPPDRVEDGVVMSIAGRTAGGLLLEGWKNAAGGAGTDRVQERRELRHLRPGDAAHAQLMRVNSPEFIEIMSRLEERAEDLVDSNRIHIALVATALVEKGKLTGGRLRRLVASADAGAGR